MKKLLSILFLIMLTITLTGCDKTDIENELNAERDAEEMLTDEEANLLDKEDPEFQADYMKELADATEEEKINEDYKLARELEDAEDAKKEGKGVKGSCDSIADNSTCIEYYGSFWTKEVIEMGCDGTYSSGPCPDDTAGGCNTGVGTQGDMVAWLYLRGGGEVTPASLKNAKMACDATMMSQWISSK